MKISFFARSGVVHCRVGGRRFSTQIKLSPSQSLLKNTVYGDGSDYVNKKLSDFRSGIHANIKSGLPLTGHDSEINTENPDVYDYARIVYSRMCSNQITSNKGTPYSDKTKQQWMQFYRLLKRAGAHVRVIDLDISGDMRTRKTASDKSIGLFNKIRSYMISNNYMVTTQNMYIEKYKILLTMAENEYLIRINKNFRYQKEQSPIVVIPPDRVKLFLSMDRPSSPEMRYAHEIACVVLVTSLRISDASSLTVDNLVDGNIVCVNKKTGVLTRSPIPKVIYDMLINNQKGGHIYSVVANRSLTDKIMSTCMPVLFDSVVPETITLYRMRPDGSGYDTTTKKLSEMVRPHMLRKSAITSMIVAGVPERFVKHLSGHSGNSKAFERYVAHVEKEFNQSINNYQNNLFNG